MDRPAPPSAPTPRVLLAEDDDELRKLLLSALERAGYQVIELEDGAEFSDYLELLQGSLRQQPDLVLTDIRMPGASGLEVVRHARGLGLSCPVLLLSAFADGEVYSVAATLGETEVLSKPMPIDAVVSRVSHWLGRAAGASGPSGPPSVGHSVLRVLVAEDSDELRLLVTEAFRRRGWEVEEVTDGMGLTARLVADPEEMPAPDVVVTDERMPWSSGLDVMQRLRALGWKTQFILVTAFADPRMRARARQLGAARVFAKPFEIDQLVESAAQVARSG